MWCICRISSCDLFSACAYSHCQPLPPPPTPGTHSSRTATPGHSVNGGFGADGPRAGGGGGGGFYGGGGGGSGQQGGGGGGGSSHADTSALAVEDLPNEWGQGENDLRVVENGDSWVEVEWERMVDAVPGNEPLLYEVGSIGLCSC